jgi:hypothetical protein
MLVLSARDTIDRRTIQAACQAAGQPARALSSWRVPDELRGRSDVRLYAEALFAEVVADPLGLALLSPADDWLAHLPPEFLGRSVTVTTLGEARAGRFPMFLKSVEDKLAGFASAVYSTADELPADASDALRLFRADPVRMDRELRLFCVDGQVVAGSGYWKDGAAWQIPLSQSGLEDAARALIDRVWGISQARLPRACVIDVTDIAGELVVLEGNGAWGAGLYASDATSALPCILGATLPRDLVGDLPEAIVRCPRLDS